ncbi:MAG: 3-hydroxyacyl-ACP dehydratase FabZ family protein [Gemmatimonadota bacterium]
MREIAACSDIFLPAGQMLMIDRICECTARSIVCETRLTNHWVFPLHFPGDPIFPGSFIIEGAGQAVAAWAWEQGMRGAPRLVKAAARFKSPVSCSDQIRLLVLD